MYKMTPVELKAHMNRKRAQLIQLLELEAPAVVIVETAKLLQRLEDAYRPYRNAELMRTIGIAP